MKKLSALLTVCLISAASFAQVSVSSGPPSIDVQVKRTIANGDDVSIDRMITGRSTRSVIAFLDNHCMFYDDEGNLFPGGIQDQNYKIFFEWDGKRYGQCHLPIERDILRKVRIIVKDVDEYAPAFSLIKLHYYGRITVA